MTFKKAVKLDAKLRLALCGPAGSGKTYSLLAIATELGGPIAYVDTEHGSASKYADLFSFDVIEPTEFDPRKLIETINEAVAGGYRIICIDSLSHYWMGKGGELEMVDNTAKRSQSGNSFAAWKTVTPIHNQLVDTIIAAPIHVLVSMRTKTEWVIDTDERGKKVPRKIGTQPVMRDGIEFEFDVCGDLDQDNTLTITKSRCPDLSGKAINRPGREMAQTLRKWLAGVKQDTPAPQQGSAPTVAAALAPEPPRKKGAIDFEALKSFGEVKKLLKQHTGSDEAYYGILQAAGYLHANEITDKNVGRKIYKEMAQAANSAKQQNELLDLLQKSREQIGNDRYNEILLAQFMCTSDGDVLELDGTHLNSLLLVLKAEVDRFVSTVVTA